MAKGLRRIAQLLAAPGNLLRKHRQVIREAEHVLEYIHRADQVLGFIDPCAGHGLDEPKGAHAEGTVPSSDAFSLVSIRYT